MKKDKQGTKAVTEVLRGLYDEIDPGVRKASEQMGATCQKGCAHCCMLLTAISLPEGMLIAETVLTSTGWEDLLPRLKASALEHCYQGVNKESYFDKKKPCVFLTEEKLCSIYEQRPACCRMHVVISDPEKCSPDNRGGRTKAIDFRSVEDVVWNFGMDVAEQVLGDGRESRICFAPIPIMVLFCMNLIFDKSHEKFHLIREANEGVPTPSRWMSMNLISLVAEGDGIIRSESGLVQIKRQP